MNLDHPLNCLTFNFQRAARSLVRGFEVAVKDAGLTAPQFTTLALLSGFGSMTVGQMAEKLGTDRTTMTRNLDLMVTKGWIVSAASDDLRIRAYQLEGLGRVQLNAAMPAWTAYQRGLVELLGPDMATRMIGVMKKL